MDILSLQSGSDGNCLYVETADAKQVSALQGHRMKESAMQRFVPGAVFYSTPNTKEKP